MPSLYITRSMRRVMLLVFALFIAFFCRPFARPQTTVIADLGILYALEVGFGFYDEWHNDPWPGALINIGLLLVTLLLGIGAGIGMAIKFGVGTGLSMGILVSVTSFALLKLFDWIATKT